jgi:hypothetical protein
LSLDFLLTSHVTEQYPSFFLCPRACHVVNRSSPYSYQLTACHTHAKLLEDGPQGELVSGAFIVSLAPGHSLQQYSDTIKVDITPYVHGVLQAVFEDKIADIGVGITDDVLKAILADEGATAVECSYWYYGADVSWY